MSFTYFYPFFARHARHARHARTARHARRVRRDSLHRLLVDSSTSSQPGKKKKKPNANEKKKGGGTDDAELVDKPVSTPPSSSPFYPDLRESEYVADWLLDYVTQGLERLYRKGGVKVVGADVIRNWMERDAATEMRKALDAKWTDPVILAPLLVKGDHWVLLKITRHSIVIFDSLRSHTGDAAHRFARSLVGSFAVLRGATVESFRSWPQQIRGSNDCSLFVMRAVQHLLSRQPVDAVMHLFERIALDGILPHIPGANVDRVKQSDFFPTLYKEATKVAFVARLQRYLDDTPPPKSSVATASKPQPVPITVPSATPSPIPSHQHKPTTATAKPPPKGAGVPPPPQAPTKTPCPWPGCKNTVAPNTGRSCDACGGRFCTRHRGSRTGAKWRCAKCVQAQALDAPCGHHQCTLQGGRVKLLEALTCTECKKFFHKRHARQYDKVKQEFHCGDCKRGYHKHDDGGNFAMPPVDPSKAAPQPGADAAPGKLGFLTGQEVPSWP